MFCNKRTISLPFFSFCVIISTIFFFYFWVPNIPLDIPFFSVYFYGSPAAIYTQQRKLTVHTFCKVLRCVVLVNKVTSVTKSVAECCREQLWCLKLMLLGDLERLTVLDALHFSSGLPLWKKSDVLPWFYVRCYMMETLKIRWLWLHVEIAQLWCLAKTKWNKCIEHYLQIAGLI